MDHSYPEALFQGIIRSVQDVYFREENRTRAIVVIGDHGNHTEYNSIMNDFTEIKVAETLKNKKQLIIKGEYRKIAEQIIMYFLSYITNAK